MQGQNHCPLPAGCTIMSTWQGAVHPHSPKGTLLTPAPGHTTRFCRGVFQPNSSKHTLSYGALLSSMQEFLLPSLKFVRFLPASGWTLGIFLQGNICLKHINEFLGLISSAPFLRTRSTQHWVAIGDDKYQAPHIDMFLALMCSIMWFSIWKMPTERLGFIFTLLHSTSAKLWKMTKSRVTCQAEQGNVSVLFIFCV